MKSRAGRRAALAAMALLLAAASVLRAQDKPNILLITVDTLRADHLASYGRTQARTPNIDALAAEGVLFENVIAQTPITLPSHATLLSGVYPFQHGLQDVVGRMRPGISTFPEWLKAKGYKTAAFVGSSVLAADWGLNRGFDFYEDSFSFRGLRQIDFSRVERPAGKVLELAAEWLKANKGQPFLIWTHLYDPHDPYLPPEPFATQFKDNLYDGEIAYVDAMLGRFFETMKAEGVWDDTLVIFLSDHGESLGEHGEEFHAYYIYESSLRVPLIFKIPQKLTRGRFEKGSRVANQVRVVDVAPTLLQLLGEPIPEQVQGEGLLALMSGRRPGVQLPAYAETHYPRIHFGWSPLFSYSNARYKFIEAPTPELYDLASDPGELKNVHAQNQALANQLREEMHALQRRYAGTGSPGDASVAADAETVERLKSLGYVAFSAGGGAVAGTSGLPDPKQKIATYNALNRAIVASREGKSVQAVQMLERIARDEPQMPLVHFLMGSEYFAQDLFLKAAEEFSRTIELNPESNVARFNLARSWMNAGLLDRAEEALRQILVDEPGNYGARHQLATLLGRKRQFVEAAAEELKALEIRPQSADSYNNLGTYYLSADRLEEALAAYRKALQLAPGNLLSRLNLSLCYLRLKRFDDAVQEASSTVRDFPKAALGHFYLGQALVGVGRLEEARKAFARAKELDPKLSVPAP